MEEAPLEVLGVFGGAVERNALALHSGERKRSLLLLYVRGVFVLHLLNVDVFNLKILMTFSIIYFLPMA